MRLLSNNRGLIIDWNFFCKRLWASLVRSLHKIVVFLYWPQPDLTLAYFWPAVNKRPARLWPEYFFNPTQWDFDYPKGKKLKNMGVLGEIFQPQRWLIRPDQSNIKMTQTGSKKIDPRPITKPSIATIFQIRKLYPCWPFPSLGDSFFLWILKNSGCHNKCVHHG